MNSKYLEKGRSNQKKQTRDNILEAAHEVLGSSGEFTLEKVAEAAGVSRATIYRYYSDKDVLSAEAALHIQTVDPKEVTEAAASGNLEETLLGIQRYYNALTADNESAFRKYISVILDSNNDINQRGARRIRALESAIGQMGSDIAEPKRKNFVHIATLLMGIEAYIVMKDVCGLDNEQADDTLAWGLQTLLRGMKAN